MASRKLNRRRSGIRQTDSHRRRPRCERLEARQLLAVVTVNTDQDVVDFNDGVTSLREAVFATNLVDGADEIRFDFGHDDPATILLTQGEIIISDPLVLSGPGANLLTIDASGNDPTPEDNLGDGSRVFLLSSGRRAPIDVSISGVTLTGGDTPGDGGAILSFANLELSHVGVVDNHAGRDGGGLFLSNHSTLDDVRLAGNGTAANGGAIRVFSGADVEIRNSTIDSNFAAGGGGGLWSTRGARTTLVNTDITRNEAAGFGGGLGLFTDTTTIRDSQIISNHGLEGGGIYTSGGALDVQNTSLSVNRAMLRGAGLRTNATAVSIQDSQIRRNGIFQNGGEGAGIYQSFGDVTMRDSTLESNLGRASSTSGGAIAVAGGMLRIEGGIINRNTATLLGGAIWAREALVHVDGVTIVNHSNGMRGGAISAADSLLTVEHAHFQSNFARNDGGAIYLEATDATIRDSRFENNSTRDGSGGAIRLESAFDRSTLEITSSVFLNNQAATHGGAIASDALAALDIRQSRFQSNESHGDGGGAIYSGLSTQLTISESALIYNRSTSIGGGVYSQGELQVDSSAIVGNQSDAHGGGIYAEAAARGSGPIRIDSTTIADNQSQGNGGGLFLANLGSEIDVVNSTISNNQASQSGGAVYLQQGRRTAGNSIRHSTIAENQDSLRHIGGGVFLAGANLSLDHSILFGNRSGGIPYDLTSPRGGLIEVNYSLVGVVYPGTQLSATNLLLGIDPQLGGLGPSGATLPLPNESFPLQVHATSLRSPAVDGGSSSLIPGVGRTPEFDQRGAPFTRVASPSSRVREAIIDLGAFELQSLRLPAYHGSFDNSGRVRGNDFLIWQRNFGTDAGATQETGDATGDGDVDHNDLAVWLATYERFVPVVDRHARVIAPVATVEPLAQLADDASNAPSSPTTRNPKLSSLAQLARQDPDYEEEDRWFEAVVDQVFEVF